MILLVRTEGLEPSREGLARRFFENIDGGRRRLSDLDEVPVRITHVASQFMAVIIERYGKKVSAFFGPIRVTGMNVCNTQIKKATYPIQIIRRREPYIRLVGLGPPPELKHCREFLRVRIGERREASECTLGVPYSHP
jgi:hypothetical protein